MKREQNHVARSLLKKPSGPKPIVCHHCGSFGHLKPHCFKFHALKRIKRKEKFELLESCALQAKLDLMENGKLLKKFFNILTSLSMYISGFHSSNFRLTSHETLIPKNHSVWIRKGSCGWVYALLVIDLILSIFVGPFMHWLSYLHAFCTSCIYLYALFLSVDLTLLVLFLSVFKNSKTHKNWKISKKFDRLYCVYYMWVWRSTFVLMVLCIYEFNLFCKHISLCEGNLENYVWLL